VQQVLDEHVVHHRQAGTATGDELVGVDPQQLGEHLAQFPQAGQAPVVAHVDTVGVLDPLGQGQQPVGQVELGAARLATGEVERQAALAQCVVGCALLLEVGLQFLGGTLGEGGGGCGVGAHPHIVAEQGPDPPTSAAVASEFAPGWGRRVCLLFGVITILRRARG
jgi:hypothetical protein